MSPRDNKSQMSPHDNKLEKNINVFDHLDNIAHQERIKNICASPDINSIKNVNNKWDRSIIEKITHKSNIT